MGRRFFHSLPSSLPSILVIQLGDIGDVVWSLPALRAVKLAHPEARLTLLVREGIGDLVRCEPHIDDVLEVRKPSGGGWETWKENRLLIKTLRRERFALVVDLRTGDRGAVLAWFSGAPLRAALCCDSASLLRNILFNRLIEPQEERIRKNLGAAEQSLRIVRALGIREVGNIPELHVAEDARKEMRCRLVRDGVKERANGGWGKLPIITVNPFSRWRYKEWDLDKWADLIARIKSFCGCRVVVVGGQEEIARMANLLPLESTKDLLNYVGRTTLSELAALLSLSRLHVGVDSAAPHIAAAVGTPTITLYGPSDWRDWAPVGEGHRVVHAGMDCQPCYRRGCDDKGERSLCMVNLPVDKVYEAVRKAFSPLPPA